MQEGLNLLQPGVLEILPQTAAGRAAPPRPTPVGSARRSYFSSVAQWKMCLARFKLTKGLEAFRNNLHFL